MITCQGKSVFSGVAIGKIFVYKKADNTVEKYQIEDAAAEFERFKAAQAKAITQLQGLYEKTCKDIGEEEAMIFEMHQQLLEDFQYKKALALRCAEYRKHYEGITYGATHGDYQGCQLIFENNEIKAVIDFSSAACLPVTWEIMRSFVQSSNPSTGKAAVDIPAFCDYVREYMRFSPLTKTDLLAMPYVYLFQLARSKFGYPQYLKSDSEDREQLLQFAFWRTQMCREVEGKAEVISHALVKLPESQDNK